MTSRTCHRSYAEAIARNVGFVAKYLGDGVSAYFGYPEAHEHDAELAVKAGLAIVEAVPELATPNGSPLHVRVGIATGIVVVGDIVGSGELRDGASAQRRTSPRVSSRSLSRLLGSLFDLKDLGVVDLKGISGPTHPGGFEDEFRGQPLRGASWEGIDASRWEGGGERTTPSPLAQGEGGRRTSRSPLRGGVRQNRVWRRSCWTASRSNPMPSSDFFPKAKLDKLDALFARMATSPEDLALFAEMLSLPNDGRYPALELSPLQRRQRTLNALVSQVEQRARNAPVLLVFEDAQWADPTNLEALGRLVDNRFPSWPSSRIKSAKPKIAHRRRDLDQFTKLGRRVGSSLKPKLRQPPCANFAPDPD